MGKGLVYVFSGEGKGKTSAALGVAIRMLLGNKRVVWVSWFKCADWNISEMGLPQKFVRQMRMYWMGEGFYVKEPSEISEGVKIAKLIKGCVKDKSSFERHKKAAHRALEKVKAELISANPPDMVVMDESIQAINDGLLTEKEVIDVLEIRGKVHMVLTGRGVTSGLVKYSDLVTEMRKVKHPYDTGILAVRGLDY